MCQVTKFNFYFLKFYMCVRVYISLFEYMCTVRSQESLEARRRSKIPWTWSYEWLWAAKWVQGTESYPIQIYLPAPAKPLTR